MVKTDIIEIYNEEDLVSLNKVADYLKDGKICVLPTETVYGLAGNIFIDDAIKNIYKAKGRPSDNPFIVHVDSVAMAETLIGEKSDIFYKLQDAFWPGPLTIICKKSVDVPKIISPNLDTVAIRMPNNKIFLDVIRMVGVPLAAPSANISGRPSPTSFKHVLEDLDGKVDCIVKSLNSDVGLESTVISIVDEVPILLRPGAVTRGMIEEVIGRIKSNEFLLKKTDDDATVISPGLKYKHYAPKTKLILLKANKTRFSLFLKKQIEENAEKVGLISFYNEEINNLPSVVIGDINDEQELNRNLFSSLRLIDSLNVDIVFFRLNGKVTNYEAFYNRILRASGFEVINCE